MRPRTAVFLLPGDWHTPTGGYTYDRRLAEGLAAQGWRIEPCVLPGDYPFPDAAARAAAAALMAALPDGALVIADGLAFGALPELAEAEAGRLRWLALVHHPLALETGLDRAARERLAATERRALATARHVVAVSAATAGALVADYGVPPDRITVVEPGTDPAPLAVGSGGPGVALLCVATLTPRKGHAWLVEALAGLTDRAWTLDCVGSAVRDPACAAALRVAVEAAGLGGRVHLHGEVDAARLAAFYDRADLFVLPSFHEGYGMVCAEALARGLPVLTTTAGALPDTVPGAAGRRVPPGDTPALREALAELLDVPEARGALAAGARTVRAQLPDWPTVAARFAAQLEALR